MKKIAYAVIVATCVTLGAGACGSKRVPAEPQTGTWDTSTWDDATFAPDAGTGEGAR